MPKPTEKERRTYVSFAKNIFKLGFVLLFFASFLIFTLHLLTTKMNVGAFFQL
jgi:hypothetical protein